MTSACAADETWRGTVSDSICGIHHEWDEHSALTTEHDCTLKCVRGGAQFVFVSENSKVYAIANQSEPALAENAGYTVQLTGRQTGGAITVSRVERAGP